MNMKTSAFPNTNVLNRRISIIIIAICHHRDQDELSISGYTILFQSFRIAHKLPGLYGYA